jgi:nitrous oxide reductase accessory protein NosL
LALKIFYFSLLVFVSLLFTACSSTEETVIDSKGKICPECNMTLSKDSHKHSSYVKISGNINYFDDAGCMILWLKEKNINIQDINIQIFSNDSSQYIDAKQAFYAIDDITPMNYGFAAFEKNSKGLISFEQMRLKMLRGEHLANPKIRKQILGN